MFNVGFIGLGNMGGALAKALFNNLDFKEKVNGYYYNDAKLDSYKNKYGFDITTNKEEFTKKNDVIFLATHVGKEDEIIAWLDQYDLSNKIIVSVLSGVSNEALASKFKNNKDIKITRSMPNINAIVGYSTSALAFNKNMNQEDINKVNILFDIFGKHWVLDEDKFSIFTIIAGCAPAYMLMMLKGMSSAAVKNGLTQDFAYEVAAQTFIGTMTNYLKSDNSADDLINSVVVPGGVTYEGKVSLEEDKIYEILERAIAKAYKKDLEG